MELIYHIAAMPDWQKALQSGEYRVSTRGKSLDDEGFIHAGTEAQVALVANAIYRDDDNLLVLVIDTGRLQPEIRYEQVPGWEAPFPHIYGPLNVDAVVQTLPLERDAEGHFDFTAEHQ
jgi:uncharacterized protein (DUF952 family)